LSKHTPGPWNWYEHPGRVRLAVRAKGCLVADVVPQDAALANAKLIAVAPEMLEALEALVAFHDPDSLRDQKGDPDLRSEVEGAWARAHAAITKAKGGP
jgi:hypothetical protein